jgi:DNA mismatch repair protein MutS
LDELRAISTQGRNSWKELKKRVTTDGHFFFENFFNNVFGYYIEVRNLHKDKVPAEWIKTNLSECGALYYGRT